MRQLFVFLFAAAALAQNAPDHPSVIAQGKTFTPRSILARNMGTPEDQTTAFPPHKIAGHTYQAVFYSSLRAPSVLTPPVIGEFNHSFEAVRKLPCDIPLGDHPAEYGMAEKYAKLKPGASNPFIDPSGCRMEADIEEAMFRAILAEQQKAAPQR